MTEPEKLRTIQDFFGPKAAGWEDRFPNDGPQFANSVRELALAPGTTALDLGCGTGRALGPLHAAVGGGGRVFGLDATMSMLMEARRLGRDSLAQLLAGDALRLPFPAAYVDAVFASGLVLHLADPSAGLTEMARVTRPGGQLAIFHPIGRKALAARHNRLHSDDDLLAPARLPGLCAATGWQIVRIDDVDDRYLALARRCSPARA